MKQITSKTNNLIKLFGKLNTSKKWRQAEGFFVVEGARLVQEAIKTNLEITNCFVSSAFAFKHPDFAENLMKNFDTATVNSQVEAKLS